MNRYATRLPKRQILQYQKKKKKETKIDSAMRSKNFIVGLTAMYTNFNCAFDSNVYKKKIKKLNCAFDSNVYIKKTNLIVGLIAMY